MTLALLTYLRLRSAAARKAARSRKMLDRNVPARRKRRRKLGAARETSVP
jgi:hypothetical protein